MSRKGELPGTPRKAPPDRSPGEPMGPRRRRGKGQVTVRVTVLLLAVFPFLSVTMQ